MDVPLCRGVYAVLILFQSLIEAKHFGMKDFNFNNILIYHLSNILPLIASIATFSFDKNIRATSTSCNYSFLSLLQTILGILAITSPRYTVCQLPGKVDNSTFLT